MSSTTQAVRNAAAALKKAADPWSKEGRETADRIVSAAISLTVTPSLDRGILDTLSGLLRRPFGELYVTHPGTALRLSAAIFTAIIHDKIAHTWKAVDYQSRSNWEQLAVILLAGVQDHVEAHSNERVKIVVAQAYYAIICHAFLSTSSTIPLSTYSASLRVSAYSLLSMTADGCAENKNKLRDNRTLGGANLGLVITLTKDYLALEQLLILLAYLLPPTEGTAAGRAERLSFLRDCFVDSTQRGKDLIELLKYVASPDWEITSDKIIDILARDISVAQPFVMKSFVLSGLSNPRLNPANRFYLDKNSILFNCEDEDGKIEGVHVPYDSIRHVDLSSSGTVVVELSSPPQCHESLQVSSNNSAITMTVMISQEDVEHFIRTLRIRGMTNRIRLNGMPVRRVTERTSVNISPTRLEFEPRGQTITSYERKVKVVEDGVLQASDPADDIVRNVKICVNKLQGGPSLPVKECPRPQDLPSIPASVTTHKTKDNHDGGCDHVSSASHHQLSSVHEDSQKCPTTTSLTPGPPPSPRGPDPPPLHSPCTPCTPGNGDNGDHIHSAHSSPSGDSHYGRPSDKELGDAVFGASDEELSSLSDTDSIFCTVQPSEDFFQPRRIIRDSTGPKRRNSSQRRRHPHLSAKPTSPVSDLTPAQDPAPEQKLVAMVKGLKVMDSQDTALDKSGLGAAAAVKRKKIVLESEEESDAKNCVPLEKSPSMSTSNPGPEKRVSRRKGHRMVTTVQNRAAALERPKRACVPTRSSALGVNVEPKARSSAVVDQSGSNKVKVEKGLTRESDGRDSPNEKVSDEQGTVRTAELMRKRPLTEGDMLVTSSKQGQSRKRARLESESISSSRIKHYRGKKAMSGGKPSRVQKTYQNRQKIERSAPGRCANRDVDYDEIPISNAALNSPTAKTPILPPTKTSNVMSVSRAVPVQGTDGRTSLPSSPTVGPTPAVEIPDDKKQEKERPRQADACRIQGPPAGTTGDDDDDPIRSFSSPPSELMPLAVDTPEPQVSAPHGTCVRSDSLPVSDSPAKSLDIGPSATTMHVRTVSPHTLNVSHAHHNPQIRNTKGVITITGSDTASRSAACDTISQRSITEDGNVGAESQSAFLAAPERTGEGSSKALTDLDYLDGPTVIAESSEQHKTRITCTKPRPVADVIDLTSDTPSPMGLPVSRCVEEKMTSPHDVPTSSPTLSKGGASEDISCSSLLDLTDMMYRDFDVSLDSSLCLPSAKTWALKRPPTPLPSRTKRKSVTFAALPEEAVEELPETSEVPAEVVPSIITNKFDELRYPDLAPGLGPGNGSSSQTDGFHCLDRGLIIEPRPIPPSPPSASRLTSQPLSLLASPLGRYSYLSGAPLSTAANAKGKHRARDTSPSRPTKAESIARGDYVTPILAVLDEINDIIKNNIQTRFEKLDGRAVELRKLILAQTKADMTALLDEYVAAFNNLVRLEAKYGAFSRRRIAAVAQARNADAQSLASLRAQIQTHDRAMQAHARQTFTVGPLPAAIQRWL